MCNKISLIMPIYNAEKYLKESIESVLSQTDVDIELILVNDGSTDNSEKIISLFTSDTRIVYLKQENRGVSRARNLGLQNASGEYVAFIDADDILEPGSLRIRVKEMAGYDILVSSYVTFGVNNEIMNKMPSSTQNQWSTIELLSEVVNGEKIGYQGYLWNKVFRANIIKNNKILFDERVYYGEDRLFVAKYITYCKNCCVSDSVAYRYRTNNQGAMSLFNNLDDSNYEKLISEFEGIQKLQLLVKSFDMNMCYRCILLEFYQAINFYRSSKKDAKKIKKCARTNMIKLLPNVLKMPKHIIGFVPKVKAIAHVILMR